MNYVLVYKLFQTFSPQMKPDVHKIITDRKGVIFSEVSASKGEGGDLSEDGSAQPSARNGI